MSDAVTCTLINLLASDDVLALAAKLLSEEEGARAASIVRLAQRRRYTIARSVLRVLLGRTLGLGARDVPLASDEHGKPNLTGRASGQIGFNLSHSRDLALIAIGPQMAIGVDIEPIAPPRPGVAEGFFSVGEIQALAALPGPAQAAGFTRLWTRKEALVKAIGLGLRVPLDTFDCPVEPAARARLSGCRFDPSLVTRTSLLDCPAPEGWTACVAVIDALTQPHLSVDRVSNPAQLLAPPRMLNSSQL